MGKLVVHNQYEFHVQTYGKQTHPPLVFLHGFMGSGQDFTDAIANLVGKYFCVTVDLPGHGLTKVWGDETAYRMENTGAALIGLLQTLNLEKCNLVGYSMGGRLALYLALIFPDYFNRVCLESASPGLQTAEQRDRRVQHDLELAKKLETQGFETFVHQWYAQPLFASARQHSSFAQMISRRLGNNPLNLAMSLRNLGTGVQPNLWQKLSRLALPMLLLTGERDLKFVTLNRQMSAHSGQMRLETAPKCGHNIHLENVALFVQKLNRFLSSNKIS
ncbi:MAG: 2-succinyl-6-hydroxy-2,4-cyclohexadiene-1-carboxylate synthase [Cyanobacteria bacterium P01_H01_bin.15]